MAEAPIFDIDEFLRTQSGAAPAAQSPTGRVPFYNRPLPGSKALRTAGRFVRGLTGPLAVAGGALAAGELLKDVVEPATVNAIAGPGPMTPDFRAQVKAAGGTDAFIRGVKARQAQPAPAPAVTPAAIEAAPVAPVQPPAQEPVDRAPTPTFRELPQANVFRERTGVRGIGGIGGVGNTEVVGRPETSSNVGNIAGNFVGALLGMKQVAGDNTRRAAQQKLLVDSITKGATAEQARSTAAVNRAKLQLGQRILDQGGTEADAAAAIAGRSAGGGTPRALPELVIPSASGPTSVPVFDPRRQTVINVPVQQQTQIYSDAKGPYRNVSGKKVYLTAEEQRKLQRAQ